MISTTTTEPSTTPPSDANRGRLLSAYRVPADHSPAPTAEAQLWVITDDLEDPDTATTMLWPSDY